MLLLHDKDEQ